MINNDTNTLSIPMIQMIIFVVLVVTLTACSSPPSSKYKAGKQKITVPEKGEGGGYYLDDGPGANPPAKLDAIPDAVPKVETLRKANMRPYVALGKSYQPMKKLGAYKKRGVASWYGRRYHGRQTASGEFYDMYAMTAAHPTLPLPSYARVTNLKNGKSVVVRVNDRGPFLASRIIDLSYTAAYKLDIIAGGHANVEVETIIPGARPTPKQTVSSPSINKTGAIYLQLGAFGTVENAQNFLSHMQAELPWLVAALGITQTDGLYKIQAGPFVDKAQAKQAVTVITQQLAIKPMLLME